MAPLTREQVRREGFRRVQIGIAGLGGVLLLVGLTEFVVDNVRKEAALQLPDLPVSDEAANVAAPATPPDTEPLADLGVTPAAAPAAVAPAPAVPDLEPDPRLQKRMDRDPREPQP
jgi:hypothetical protein